MVCIIAGNKDGVLLQYPGMAFQIGIVSLRPTVAGLRRGKSAFHTSLSSWL